EMFGQSGHQVIPLFPVLGRRHDRLVPEGLVDGLRRKLWRHETQFDKRTDTLLEQTVVDLIDIRKVVEGRSLSVLVVKTDFILQNAMEANILQPGSTSRIPKIAAIAITQAEDGAAGAEHGFPEVWKGMRGRRRVD